MAILSIGDIVDETAIMVSSSINKMVCQGVLNGISFDLKKTEVIYFSCGKLRTVLVVYYDISEKYTKLALYWLGIQLNSRLVFQIYIEKQAVKVKAITYYL